MEYEAKRLEMEEKVAKAQAIAKILDLLDICSHLKVRKMQKEET